MISAYANAISTAFVNDEPGFRVEVEVVQHGDQKPTSYFVAVGNPGLGHQVYDRVNHEFVPIALSDIPQVAVSVAREFFDQIQRFMATCSFPAQ